MPVLPVAPFPTIAAVMNRARAFVNDSYNNGAGRILTNQKPFSVEYLNSALEELSDRIRNNGIITLTKDNVIVGPIPALAQPDPGQQIMLAYTGLYVNGTWQATPKLPVDLVEIDKIWERQAGSALPFNEMIQPMEGLPSVYQGPWLRMWEYRQDMIVMPGSTTTEELRLRYKMQFVPIGPDSEADDWENVQIGILCSVNTLASIVAYNYARARGAAAVQQVGIDAEKFIRLVVNRYVRRAQRIRYSRRAYGETQLGMSRTTNNLPY